MKIIFTGIFLAIFSASLPGQETFQKEKKPGTREKMKILSAGQINQLKNGTLLVILKTRKNTIDAYRKAGKIKLADKLEEQQIFLNESIVGAFKENFNFCPVYFFLSDYARDIKNKNFKDVVFLDRNFEPDTNLKFMIKNFFIAEFGNIEQDTAKYFDGYHAMNTNKKVEKKAKYHGGPNMGFRALIIMSDQLVQLARPFPYYIRTFDSLWLFERNAETVVKKLNKKLNKFYNKVN